MFDKLDEIFLVQCMILLKDILHLLFLIRIIIFQRKKLRCRIILNLMKNILIHEVEDSKLIFEMMTFKFNFNFFLYYFYYYFLIFIF